MTTTQLYFAILGSVTALFTIQSTLLKFYLDAKLYGLELKIDPLKEQVDLLVQYMILHEGKIAALEERTKKL